MKVLTLWEPWATLVALGVKQYETRSWLTNYRGQLLIHAAKRPVRINELRKIGLIGESYWASSESQKTVRNALYPFLWGKENFHYGHAICIVEVTDCIKMTDEVIKSASELDINTGIWTPDRYAWKLENPTPIKPIPCQGKQGLWNLDLEIAV